MNSSSRNNSPAPDTALRESLRKAYETRAKLFVHELRKRTVNPLIAFLEQQRSAEFEWKTSDLSISAPALRKVRMAGVELHLVFCHADLLSLNRQLIDYYRNLASLSRKGLSQILRGTPANSRLDELCRIVNKIISAIIEEMPVFDLALARAVIPAEIGAEIQGTWVNIIGRGAAKKAQELIKEYAQAQGWIAKTDREEVVLTAGSKKKNKSGTRIVLTNGWSIIFADEPDIAIRDRKGTLRSAIEIKGSLDKAGAQTRYGEAKKSFAKALREHAQCETIYLASCFTDAVEDQIRSDAYVRKWFNLVDVLADREKRTQFLDELFVHVIRIGS